MNLSAIPRLFSTFALIVLTSTIGAQTPAPNTAQWENDSLKLRLFYPSDLTQQPAAQAMQDGHLTLFGLSDIEADSKAADLTRCLRPVLLLDLPHSGPAQAASSQSMPDGSSPTITVTSTPAATILLAELDINCLSSQQLDSNSLLAEMAELVNKISGMKSIAPPSTYTIGWQKVHMAAAQGQPQTQSASSTAKSPVRQQLFTMGISTNWHSHLLIWYLSSNNIDTLNRITKTTVRFGRAQAAPLYPIVIGTAGH